MLCTWFPWTPPALILNFVKTRSEYGLATSRHECDEILRCVSTGVFTISHRFHGYTSAYTYSNIALDCELWWIYSDLLDNLNKLTDQRTRLFQNSVCPMTRREMSRSSCGPFWAIMLCTIFLLVFLSLKKKGKEQIIWTITWNLIHILVGHNSSYDITAISKSIEISRSYYIEAGHIETTDDCCL